MRPRWNGRHFSDNILKYIFLNKIVFISIKISLKFIPKDLINNIPTLVQIMAWRRPGDKPISEPMLVSLLTHICVARPQWVKRKVICLTFKANFDDNHDVSRQGNGFYLAVPKHNLTQRWLSIRLSEIYCGLKYIANEPQFGSWNSMLLQFVGCVITY